MRPGTLAALLLALQVLGPAAQLLAPVAPASLTLALNANDALCLLVGSALPAVQFMVLAVLRRVLEDALYFTAGRRHGSGTLARLGLPPLQQAVSVPLLALLPSAPLHVAAGAAGMRPVVFFCVDTIASAVRVAALRWAGATRWAASLHSAALACCVAATIVQLARMLTRAR
jgi:membrane protein DedA with SNARE-associated domain